MYPHERSLVEKYRNAPFVIIGVNSDKDRAQLRPELEKNGITWRSFWNGEKGTGGPIAAAWNIRGWPTLYVIDAKGTIVFKSLGANVPAMDAAIEKALSGAGK
jgi:hypothetical protein